MQGGDLVHFWRDGANAWHGPIAIPGGGVSGHPGFVQARDGTFQVVAPLAVGGMGHWIRDAAKQWSGPTGFGSGTVRAVGLIQSNFGAGNLDLVARSEDGVDHYFAVPAGGGGHGMARRPLGEDLFLIPRPSAAAMSLSSREVRQRSTSRRCRMAARFALGLGTGGWAPTRVRS